MDDAEVRAALCDVLWPEGVPTCCSGHDCGCLGMPTALEWHSTEAAVAATVELVGNLERERDTAEDRVEQLSRLHEDEVAITADWMQRAEKAERERDHLKALLACEVGNESGAPKVEGHRWDWWEQGEWRLVRVADEVQVGYALRLSDGWICRPLHESRPLHGEPCHTYALEAMEAYGAP